jgi:hypothetical protein
MPNLQRNSKTKAKAKVGRKPGTRSVVTDEQLALIVFLAKHGVARMAIARATGISRRMVYYLIDRHCPKAPNRELSVEEILK